MCIRSKYIAVTPKSLSFVTKKVSTLNLLYHYISNDKFFKQKISFLIIYIRMNFWQNVDSELEYLGKTRKELAAAVGFAPANISFGIKRNSVPYADTALKVARFLGVSLEYLLEMNESPILDSEKSKFVEIENKLRRFSQSDLDAILSVVNALNEKYCLEKCCEVS
ncbi:MAG: helix-turn-helix transcriptional regulator [Spirochaetaceae bacterium]|nr:helix-turn-helix transcriptional regulator [Spirochaetaceae bacterium]